MERDRGQRVANLMHGRRRQRADRRELVCLLQARGDVAGFCLAGYLSGQRSTQRTLIPRGRVGGDRTDGREEEHFGAFVEEQCTSSGHRIERASEERDRPLTMKLAASMA